MISGRVSIIFNYYKTDWVYSRVDCDGPWWAFSSCCAGTSRWWPGCRGRRRRCLCPACPRRAPWWGAEGASSSLPPTIWSWSHKYRWLTNAFLKILASFWQPFLFMTAWNISTITQLYHHQPRWKSLNLKTHPLKQTRDFLPCINNQSYKPDSFVWGAPGPEAYREKVPPDVWDRGPDTFQRSHWKFWRWSPLCSQHISGQAAGSCKEIFEDFLLKFASSVFLRIPPDRPTNDRFGYCL